MTRAWFENSLGHHFSKDFSCSNEMELFISKAALVGTKLIGFTSIDFLEDA